MRDIVVIFPNGGGVSAQGQSFKTPATGRYFLDSAKFWQYRPYAPPGGVKAHLYAHSGTFGTSSVPATPPTSPPLAASDLVPGEDIPESAALLEYKFSGAERILLAQDTPLCIMMIAFLAPIGAGYNIRIGEDSSSPTHPGNMIWCNSGAWQAISARDVPFYVYGIPAVDLTILEGENGTTNPAAGVYTKEEETELEVLAIPNLGYFLKNWLLDGEAAGAENPYPFIFDEDHTLEPVFELIPVKKGGRKPRIRRTRFKVEVPVLGALSVRSKASLDVEGSLAADFKGFWPVQASLSAPFNKTAPINRIKSTSTLRKILMEIVRDKT